MTREAPLSALLIAMLVGISVGRRHEGDTGGFSPGV
jgi:hypothetical protein